MLLILYSSSQVLRYRPKRMKLIRNVFNALIQCIYYKTTTLIIINNNHAWLNVVNVGPTKRKITKKKCPNRAK